MSGYTKKQCLEEFLHSINRAKSFTEKVPGRNVPKELKKYGLMLDAIQIELAGFEEKLFKAQWDKELEQEDE